MASEDRIRRIPAITEALKHIPDDQFDIVERVVREYRHPFSAYLARRGF